MEHYDDPVDLPAFPLLKWVLIVGALVLGAISFFDHEWLSSAAIAVLLAGVMAFEWYERRRAAAEGEETTNAFRR